MFGIQHVNFPMCSICCFAIAWFFIEASSDLACWTRNSYCYAGQLQSVLESGSSHSFPGFLASFCGGFPLRFYFFFVGLNEWNEPLQPSTLHFGDFLVRPLKRAPKSLKEKSCSKFPRFMKLPILWWESNKQYTSPRQFFLDFRGKKTMHCLGW